MSIILMPHCETFYDKMKKKSSENLFPLESLRIDHTTLTQDEFIVQCGYKRATYQRWQSGTPIRLTPEQVAKTCLVCGISLRMFFKTLGIDVSHIPDDLPPH